ncbi:hypothetical protein J8E27_12560 [Brucella sp. 458]|uniref:hypothetical protein n=1 Tax=Brucella sp. 458 TaxID=2821140 RepID=UPI001ADFABCE|nr:hypothetical protein [Brucella sp. 458]QTO00543.1 hypothetical protein J8E27_12560 [Brucella sp. 458]
MKNFGKMTFSPEPVEQDGKKYNVLFLRDENGVDWFDLAQENPHPLYIAVNAGGVIFQMERDYQAIQTEGVLVGIDSDFGFTRGPGGTVYGKVWNGATIIDPDANPTPEQVRERMPNLSARQLRLGLLHLGKLSDVPVAISALPEPEKSQAQIEWDYASEFRRLHPLIVRLIPILGLTDEQVDPVWEQFATV